MNERYLETVYHENENPDLDSEAQIREDFVNMPMQGDHDDGIDEMENGFTLSQSEIIDFSQGVDSSVEGNK